MLTNRQRNVPTRSKRSLTKAARARLPHPSAPAAAPPQPQQETAIPRPPHRREMPNVYANSLPEGYVSLAEAGQRYGMTANAIRIMARRQQVRAVVIRTRIFVYLPDLDQVFTPRPYLPTANAA